MSWCSRMSQGSDDRGNGAEEKDRSQSRLIGASSDVAGRQLGSPQSLQVNRRSRFANLVSEILVSQLSLHRSQPRRSQKTRSQQIAPRRRMCQARIIPGSTESPNHRDHPNRRKMDGGRLKGWSTVCGLESHSDHHNGWAGGLRVAGRSMQDDLAKAMDMAEAKDKVC